MTGRIETTRRIPPLWCLRDLTLMQIETRDAGKNRKMECIRCLQSSSSPSKKKRNIDRFRIGRKRRSSTGIDLRRGCLLAVFLRTGRGDSFFWTRACVVNKCLAASQPKALATATGCPAEPRFGHLYSYFSLAVILSYWF